MTKAPPIFKWKTGILANLGQRASCLPWEQTSWSCFPPVVFPFYRRTRCPSHEVRAGLAIGWKPNFHSSFVISGVAVKYGFG
jgi:hypothetical protein